MRFTPLQGRICVREFKPDVSDGGIIIPLDYYRAHERETTSHRGTVLAMGRPACTPSGVPVVPEFQVGDTVHFVFSAGNGVEGGGATEKSRSSFWIEDGLPCVWLVQEEIIAVEDDDGQQS